MKRVFAILASCIALVACERYFDVSRQVEGSTVWMTFIPSNDYDTTFFILQATTPLVGSATPVLTRDEQVEVLVNGSPLAMEKSSRSVADKMQYYATTHMFAPGDKVDVVATVPGTGSVSASCEVPEPFPACTWTATLVPRTEYTETLILDIDYDDPGGRGYYGAVILEYTESYSQYSDIDPETGERSWMEIEHSKSTRAMSACSISNSEGLAAAGESPAAVAPDYYNSLSGSRYGNVQIWCDVPGTSIAGSRRHMTLASLYSAKPGRTDYYDSRGNLFGWVDRSYKYQVVLYHFSESYYNYLMAQYNARTSDFSELGLTPPSFVYSNVKGGAGVCGSYTILPSDWFDLP